MKRDGFETLSKRLMDTGTEYEYFQNALFEHLIMLQYTSEKCVKPKNSMAWWLVVPALKSGQPKLESYLHH